ncbi:hypothetical protein [Streptomyces carpinensis]|uniref:Uncharacterized protein n=1 Tax=Streptomyces carpinensis TaxID=66369 RepID=A0ABV1W8L8_9ACTN|nr:hypothetical protein [Streptomyces carpinensis]
MDRLTVLHRLVPDWPELPAADQCVPDRLPVPPEEWPPLAFTWRDIRPTVLPGDLYGDHRTDSLLQVDGAPAPVAYVSWSPTPGARYGHGWLWRCQVRVIEAHGDSFDCTTSDRSTTRDSARDAASAHVRDAHADAAVLYGSRRFHAVRNWI